MSASYDHFDSKIRCRELPFLQPSGPSLSNQDETIEKIPDHDVCSCQHCGNFPLSQLLMLQLPFFLIKYKFDIGIQGDLQIHKSLTNNTTETYFHTYIHWSIVNILRRYDLLAFPFLGVWTFQATITLLLYLVQCKHLKDLQGSHIPGQTTSSIPDLNFLINTGKVRT